MKIFAIIMIAMVVAALPATARIISIPDDFPSIQAGILASVDGDTVLVDPGTYYENIDFSGRNIVLASLFLIIEDKSYLSSTIIDGSGSETVIWFDSQENESAVLYGFTIQNGNGAKNTGGGIRCLNSSPTISYNIIKENQSTIRGGGIYCGWYSQPVISYNIISGNITTGGGGGISCFYLSSPSIHDNLIHENTSDYGGGINIEFSNPEIKNNIISGNTARTGGGINCIYNSDAIIRNNAVYKNQAESGGGIRSLASYPEIVNNIIWGNYAPDGPQLLLISTNPPITYCDVEGGWDGTGNINANPYFRNADGRDFHLMSTYCGDPYDSPCIDAGDPSLADSLLECGLGLGEPRSDIGIFGGGTIMVDVRDSETIDPPKTFGITENYPNPFNGSTVLAFDLPKQSAITISVFDLMGRQVADLFSGVKEAGRHRILWNASAYPSGVYFGRIETADSRQTARMVLLK